MQPTECITLIPILVDTCNNLAFLRKPIEHIGTNLIIELGSHRKHQGIGTHHVFLVEHSALLEVFGMAFKSPIDSIP
ncbi:MAG TPA: hypothetical protein VJ863_05955, partial [Sphaerochaeta sp.]|nr:hypothetical protein [Sphaerochaeta sp.]